jgi:hypothetical protein
MDTMTYVLSRFLANPHILSYGKCRPFFKREENYSETWIWDVLDPHRQASLALTAVG